MFDMERILYPMIVEAHGSRWVALYRSQTTDTHHTYIAVPAVEEGNTSLELPQLCSLIAVPLTAVELEGVARRKEREAAEEAREAAKKEKKGG